MNAVLVTGDSKGIGHEMVSLLLKEENYLVVGVSRTKTPEVEELEKQYPATYIHYNYDLADSDGIKDFYLHSLKRHGPFVGLVNNAGIAYDDIVTNARIDPLEKMFRVNVYSPIMFSKYIIRDMMLHNTKGSLIHISSVCAHTGYKGLSMYSATKGALEAFSRTVAREWGGVGIRSNCIAPGFIETGMSETLSREQKDRIFKRTSLKKGTEPSDIAETVRFLLSENSGSITGAVLSVDCGTI